LGITIGLSGNLSKTQQSQFAGRVYRGGDDGCVQFENLRIWEFEDLGQFEDLRPFENLSYLQI
jgi:hypothetical protein